MNEKLRHTKRISNLLDRRKRKEAIELHNAHVAEQFGRAKAGETIQLTDLMAAKEVLEARIEDEREER